MTKTPTLTDRFEPKDAKEAKEMLDFIKGLEAVFGGHKDGPCDCENCRIERKMEDLAKGGTKFLGPLPQPLQALIDGYKDAPPIIEWEGSQRIRSAFDPLLDACFIEARHRRRHMNEWARHLCHELIHSTGAVSRLGRATVPQVRNAHKPYETEPVNKRAYHLEEVIAEKGAQLLLKHCGLFDNRIARLSDGYLLGYLEGFWEHEKRDEADVLAEAKPFVKAAVNRILGPTAFKPKPPVSL
jgi:hypothetical protein